MGPSEPACQLENVALPVPQEYRAMARSFLMPGQAEGDGGSSRGLRAESPGHGAHSSQPRHCRPSVHHLGADKTVVHADAGRSRDRSEGRVNCPVPGPGGQG